MKYCLDYSMKNKHCKDADELMIRWTENSDMEKLFGFIESSVDVQKQRVIIMLETRFIPDAEALEFYIQKLQTVIEKTKCKIALLLSVTKLYEALEFDSKPLLDYNMPFFFNTPITNWDALHSIIECGVSDVYICEELAFSMEYVANICHAEDVNVQIRVFPNICQSSSPTLKSMYTFFIRPNDVHVYDGYVDVIEFYEVDPVQQETLYSIYVRGAWAGRLGEIIKDFGENLKNNCIMPDFAQRRLNCGKRCMQGRGCRKCEYTQETAEILESHGLDIQPDFDKIFENIEKK